MLPQHACHSENHVFDRWILWLVAILAALPFGEVFYLRFEFATVSIFEQLYLLLILVLMAKIIYEKRTKYPFVLLLFSLVVISSVFLSSTIGGISIAGTLRHLRFYLPFIVATLLLAVNIKISFDRYLHWLTIAAIISSLLALYIHHFAPEFLSNCLAVSEVAQDVAIVHGRLRWTNAPLVLLVLLCVFLRPRCIPRQTMLFAFITSFVATFNTSNRSLLLGCVGFFLGAVAMSVNSRQAFARIALGTTIVLLAAISVSCLLQTDGRLRELVDLRFLGHGDVSEIYEQAVTINRVPHYEEYAERIRASFVVGQGLGRPFSVITGQDVFIADISLVAFLLPFGIMGIVVFGVFVMKLVTLIRRAPTSSRAGTSSLVLLLLALCLILSLNLDLFSRNNFVIYFTLLVMTLQNQTPLDTDKRFERRYARAPSYRHSLPGLRT